MTAANRAEVEQLQAQITVLTSRLGQTSQGLATMP